MSTHDRLDELLETIQERQRVGERLRKAVNRSANGYYKALLRDARTGEFISSRAAREQKAASK